MSRILIVVLVLMAASVFGVHMIEETARHAGHADLLRELTDGTTGE